MTAAGQDPPKPRRQGLLGKISGSGRGGGGGGFLQDIGLLLAGSGGAQLIMLASAPLLARIYSPADFAALALLTSCFQIISRFSSFKYETALATGRNKPEMGALAMLAASALVLISVLTALFSAFLFPLIAAQIGPASAIAFCLVLPLVVLFDGMIRIVVTWAVRWREFKTVSANDVVRNGASVATQVGAGLAGLLSSGLLLGQAVGTVAAFAVLARRRSTSELFGLMRRGSWVRRRVAAKRFADFPMFQMPKAIFNAMGRNMPTILMAVYYSAAATGFFFFALRLTALPAQLISASLGRVLMQRFAQRWVREGKSIAPMLIKSTALFLVPALAFILLMALFGERLFVIFLGEQWRVSGTLAVWTVIWSAATIIGTPAQMAMTVLRQNKVMLVLEVIFLPLRLAPFPFFAAQGDYVSAIAICCCASALFNSVMIVTAIVRAQQLARKGAQQTPNSAPNSAPNYESEDVRP